jgi:hypothetical protein
MTGAFMDCIARRAHTRARLAMGAARARAAPQGSIPSFRQTGRAVTEYLMRRNTL